MMSYQVLYLWITLLCAVQSTYSAGPVSSVREIAQRGVAKDDSSSNYSYSEDIYRFVENATYAATSEENIGNNTLRETMPTSNVSLPAEDTAEVSVFTSNFSVEMTAAEELPETKEDSEMPEANMTSTIIDLPTTVGLENTEEPDKCIPDNCTAPHHCIFVKSAGCIRLREGDTENKMLFYTILVPNESSLIYVEMGNEDEDLPNSTITVEFKECGTTKAIWVIESGEQIRKQTYVSGGPNLTLHISTDRNWVNSTVYYRELEFLSLVEEVDDSLDAGILVPPIFEGLRCRPNTRKTYLLTASKSKWNESSVTMTLSFVDLDELAGDYLLIGAGKNLFAGPHPFFFTGQVSESRDYYIASDDVYVVYASGASQKTDKKGFLIQWERSGTAITKPDEEPDEETITDSVLQSVGICFYNKSFIAEFNRTEDFKGPLQSFRERLASVANSYAKQRNIPLDSMLTASSVEIFRVSSIIEPREDVMPEGGVYVMVTIVPHFDRKSAVFRRDQLERIVDQLEKNDEETGYSILGFKVGQCPAVESYFMWYLAAVLLVIISSLVLMIVWICSSLSTWRGLPRDKKFSHGTVNMFYKDLSSPARENEYTKYIPALFNRPRLKLTACDGDTITLDSSDSLGQSKSEIDDASERVIFDQSWLLKKRPSRKELPASLTANADSEPSKPFLQTFAAPLPTTRNKGSGRMWMDIPMDRLLPQENPRPVDHEYDCLVFPNSVCQKKSEGETKL